MNETNFEGAKPQAGMGSGSAKVTLATIFAAVLITCILAGCFLTALIMVLDALPLRHILVH